VAEIYFNQDKGDVMIRGYDSGVVLREDIFTEDDGQYFIPLPLLRGSSLDLSDTQVYVSSTDNGLEIYA